MARRWTHKSYADGVIQAIAAAALPLQEHKKGSRCRLPFASRLGSRCYHMATGLMIICTAPFSLAWPRTNMNSCTLSLARRPVFMVSRM